MELERKGGSRKMQRRYLRWDRGKDIKILKGTNAEGNDEKQSGEGRGGKYEVLKNWIWEKGTN